MHLVLLSLMFLIGTATGVGVMYESYTAKKDASERMMLVLLWLSWPAAILVGYLIYLSR